MPEDIQYERLREETFALDSVKVSPTPTASTTYVKSAYGLVSYLRFAKVLATSPVAQGANLVARALIMPAATQLAESTGVPFFKTVGTLTSESIKFAASPTQYVVSYGANKLMHAATTALGSYVTEDVTITLPFGLSTLTIPQEEIRDFLAITAGEIGHLTLKTLEKQKVVQQAYSQMDARLLGKKIAAPVPAAEQSPAKPKRSSMEELTPEEAEGLEEKTLQALAQAARLAEEQKKLDEQPETDLKVDTTDGCPHIPYNNLTRAKRIIGELDFSSPPGKAIFYSGPINRTNAEQLAQQIGGTTLEMLPAGQCMENNELFQDPQYKSYGTQLWGLASEQYAKHASGDVYVFTYGRDPKEYFWSTFRCVELPAFCDNPNVNNIIICHRLEDGIIQQEAPIPRLSLNNLFYGD